MSDQIAVILFFLGGVLFVAGNVAMTMNAFAAGLGWGIFYIFVPVFGAAVTLVFRWEQAKVSFCILTFGILLSSTAIYLSLDNPQSEVSIAVNRYKADKGYQTLRVRIQRLFEDFTKIARKDGPRPLRPTSKKRPDRNTEAETKLQPESLLEAVREGNMGFVQVWINKGTDLNEFSESDTTALMEASAYGYTEIVKILIERGANPLLVNSENKMAIDFARENMRAGIVEILLKYSSEEVSAATTSSGAGDLKVDIAEEI